MTKKHLANAGLMRRFAAMVYDAFLLAAVLFIAGIPLPLIPETWLTSFPVTLAIRGYLLLVCFLFFAWFWVHGGQTLGMRAWGLRVVSDNNSRITWVQASKRFFSALLSWICAGLGFIWILFSPNNLAWHDRLSNTRIVRHAN